MSTTSVSFWVSVQGGDHHGKVPRRISDVWYAHIARFYKREPKHPIPGTRTIKVNLRIPDSYLTLTEPVVEVTVAAPEADETVTGSAGA